MFAPTYAREKRWLTARDLDRPPFSWVFPEYLCNELGRHLKINKAAIERIWINLWALITAADVLRVDYSRRLILDANRKWIIKLRSFSRKPQQVVDVTSAWIFIRTSIQEVLEFKPDMLDANPQSSQPHHDKRKAKSLPRGECRLLPETIEYFTFDIGTLCSLVNNSKGMTCSSIKSNARRFMCNSN